ncbi:MAG: replication initiation protein [Brevinematales bacterium]|nr:replication initiation protein [Brevinematales bacterium]
MPRKDPKKYLVRQSNTLSFSRHNLNALEKRIVYLLISKIKQEDKKFQDYVFTVKELLEGIEIGADNHTYLKETTESLLSKVYQIPTEDGGLLQVSPISSAEYDKNNTTVTFSFDPKVKPHYLELKQNYTQFQLNIVIGLKSVYSQKLYEMAKSIANKGDPTVRYSIAEWRYLLFIEPEEYKFYADMRRYVFQIAQRELDEKTDIHIEFKEEKAGKRVNWLWMEVHKIENEEQRQAWIRQTKFNQLPKKVRESLLQSSGATEKSTLDDVAANVAARQKAIAEAEEMGLFDKKTDTPTPDDESNEE